MLLDLVVTVVLRAGPLDHPEFAFVCPPLFYYSENLLGPRPEAGTPFFRHSSLVS